MRSRVIPGSFVTIERRVPVKRLKSVDLPTLGRPTMTMMAAFVSLGVLTARGGTTRLSQYAFNIGDCSWQERTVRSK